MKKQDWLLISAIGIICSLLMLPRILSAQFGLLDDGQLLLRAQQVLRDPGSALYQFRLAGRFLPTALLLRGIVFSFAGFDPRLWYVWLTVCLVILCLAMTYIARAYGFSRVQALVSVLFFVISPTLIESFYTLAKSEIPLLILICTAILLTMTYTSVSNRFMKAFIVILCSFLLLLSFAAKETAIVLPFLFLSWVVSSWFVFRKTGKYRDLIYSDAILLIGSLIGCLLYWVFRSLSGIGGLGSYAGGYELFNFEKILFNFNSLLGWLIRDYFYLLPILSAILFVRSLQSLRNIFFILRWFSWMLAWTLIFLPWNYLSYYLLPFSFGAALISGVVLGEMLSSLLCNRGSNPKIPSENYRSISQFLNRVPFLWLISFAFIIPSAFNAVAFGTEQLIFDRANWQMLEQVIKLPQNSQLVVNLSDQDEYFYEIKLFVNQILNRPDILIEAYQP